MEFRATLSQDFNVYRICPYFYFKLHSLKKKHLLLGHTKPVQKKIFAIIWILSIFVSYHLINHVMALQQTDLATISNIQMFYP